MKKGLLDIQYGRLLNLYKKLNDRLNRNFYSRRFEHFCKRKQEQLILRLAKLKQQLLLLERATKVTSIACLLSYSMNLSAQSPVASGSEFRVNTQTTSSQNICSVAMDAEGDFVFVWQGGLQDGDAYGIYAQRYNSSGIAQGSEFRVNTYTTNNQKLSAVAMDSDGDFVIVWSGYGDQDGNNSGVYAQRYNALGVAQGTEFRVNTSTMGNQYDPSIGMNDDGDFVISWTGNQDGNYNVYAQRYNAIGVAQDSEFRVNNYTPGGQHTSSIDMGSDGDFVVTWQSANQDGDGYGIYAQRYNSAGIAQNSEFRVNTNTINWQQSPSISIDNDGDFVITWQSANQDGNGNGVYAQRYSSTGLAQGSEFLVNTYTTSNQGSPSISMNSDGDFVITWNSTNQDGSGNGVYAQRYNASGVAQGSEFRVNSYTTDSQAAPSTAMANNGDFVIGWYSTWQDGNNNGIYAQRYIMPNQTPTDITLSATSLDENSTSGTVIGDLSTTDPDASNTFTYSLVSGAGDDDNSSFTIDGDKLKIVLSPDFETKNSYNVRIRTTDQGGLSFEKVVTISIADVNEAPADLSLNNTSVDENVSANSTIGVLSSTDVDASGSFTYSLVGGTGDADNGAFTIDEDELKISSSPDFETKNSYSIRVRTTDQGSLTFEKIITILVSDLNETPLVTSETFTVDENASNGTAVGTVSASDVDNSQTLSYSIVSGNTGNVFLINSATGEITVAGSLDYETTASYTLSIEVEDDGSPVLTGSATVTINVNNLTETGINDASVLSSVQLFPNPSSTQVEIRIEGETIIFVSDLSGKIVKEVILNDGVLDISELMSGIYLVEIVQGEKRIVRKLVVE